MRDIDNLLEAKATKSIHITRKRWATTIQKKLGCAEPYCSRGSGALCYRACSVETGQSEVRELDRVVFIDEYVGLGDKLYEAIWKIG